MKRRKGSHLLLMPRFQSSLLPLLHGQNPRSVGDCLLPRRQRLLHAYHTVCRTQLLALMMEHFEITIPGQMAKFPHKLSLIGLLYLEYMPGNPAA